jgi:hypothetical protein
MMLQVDNSGEIFGAKVSIADLAINGFDRYALPAALDVKRQLEKDWKHELESCTISVNLAVAKFKDGSRLYVGDGYAKLDMIPRYAQYDEEASKGVAPDGKLWWSHESPPPAIGSRIRVRINNLGPATVTGYFRQDGFLGVLCRLEDPPEWHRKQNNNDPTGHVFGAEIAIEQEAS